MKKFSIVLCIMFLFTGIASAGITKQKDKFDGTITIKSDIDDKFFTGYQIFFIKEFPKGLQGKYNIYLQIFHTQDVAWNFSENPFELNIDGAIYKTSTVKTFSYAAEKSLSNNHEYFSTSGKVVLDSDLINKILNSKKIQIRYHFSNHEPKTYTLLSKELNEWKKVIMQDLNSK